MQTKQMTISQQAMKYHAIGYSVIPVKQDKRPALASWKKYQDDQASIDEVAKWFKDDKTNIGIVTGKVSGITVIDIDTKSGQADEMLAKFPPTLTVQTPSKGYHLYYQYAEGFTVSANAYAQFPNVDLRGDTGYVVAPPSKTEKGEYKIIKNIPLALFPIHLFPQKKIKLSITEQTTANNGSRNTTLASFIGKLLQATKQEEWESEVYPAGQRANLTYKPPLAEDEVRATFESIMKKEIQRRSELIVSPLQMEDGSMSEPTVVKLHRNKSNTPHSNMANVIAVLGQHPYYKDTIKYNVFKQEIEYNNKTLEDSDLYKIQHFLQTQVELPNIGKEAVFAGVLHYATKNSYDEAQDWLKSLVWDNTPRLLEWLPRTTHVENDEYHQTIGANWLMGMIKRIMIPGCQWDYMLVVTGAQGVRKTSMFRIIGGKWYKSYTGGIDSKDFYLALRGCMLLDLDEGATLYRSEAIKIKSIITETHDEYRAPYDRIMKKYPRRFVFSMSTNDATPFQDVTGNRRYWVLDIPNQTIDTEWLEENRDQLFAEAYHYFKNKMNIQAVPMEIAEEKQQQHLVDDSWTDLVGEEVRRSADYCEGSEDYSTTIQEIFSLVFPNESNIRLDKRIEMRMGNIFRKELGLEKKQKMVDGVRKNRYYINDKKLKELKNNNAKKVESINDFDEAEQGEMEF
jgi:hypothetical protein